MNAERAAARRLRVLTGLVGVPLAVAAVFLLPTAAFLLLVLALLCGAAAEYARMAQRWTPGVPAVAVPLLVAGAVGGVYAAPAWAAARHDAGAWLIVAFAALVLAAVLTVFLTRAAVDEAALALGLIAFAVPYFAVPVLCLVRLHQTDPRLLLLLLVVVWSGDTAAYYLGSRFGRHRLAPAISPNKSWEGALGGLVASVLIAGIWSAAVLERLDLAVLAVAAVAAVAGQVGDLVESLFKRGAGVKDSSNLLPGHGGLFDRCDALLLAAPTFLLGLWLLGVDAEPH